MLRARIEGHSPPKPFHYRDYGELAVLGRSAAVADFGWIRLTGVFAWMIWSAVHLFLLLGARNKMVVYLNWVWAWITYGSGARLMTGIDRAVAERSERQRADQQADVAPARQFADRHQAQPSDPGSSRPGASGLSIPAHDADEAASRA